MRWGGGGVEEVRCILLCERKRSSNCVAAVQVFVTCSLRQLHSHLMMRALRSTMDGGSLGRKGTAQYSGLSNGRLESTVDTSEKNTGLFDSQLLSSILSYESLFKPSCSKNCSKWLTGAEECSAPSGGLRTGAPRQYLSLISDLDRKIGRDDSRLRSRCLYRKHFCRLNVPGPGLNVGSWYGVFAYSYVRVAYSSGGG